MAFFVVLNDNISKLRVVKNREFVWYSAYKTLLESIVRSTDTHFCLIFVEQWFLATSHYNFFIRHFSLHCCPICFTNPTFSSATHRLRSTALKDRNRIQNKNRLWGPQNLKIPACVYLLPDFSNGKSQNNEIRNLSYISTKSSTASVWLKSNHRENITQGNFSFFLNTA